MSEENDSVLGNLPRSRPGVRSEKRASGKPAATKPRAKAAAKPKAAKPKAAKPSPPPATPPPASSPIESAVKAGEAVALTGVRIAGRLAGEVLRRLPRP